MANVSVYNMEGKEVGTMDLNDSIFAVEINEHLVHMAVVQQHRSCKTGFHQSSAVDRRRRGIRSAAERVFFQDEQEREESCS